MINIIVSFSVCMRMGASGKKIKEKLCILASKSLKQMFQTSGKRERKNNCVYIYTHINNTMTSQRKTSHHASSHSYVTASSSSVRTHTRSNSSSSSSNNNKHAAATS